MKNAEKVLSVYEPDAQVIVRGKAGQEVEFGNTLFLGESVEGYLLDWKLYGSRTPSENEQMQESLQRQNRFNLAEPIAAMCADRGFASQRARRQLAQEGIYDALCPRDPKQLKKTDGGTTLQAIAKAPGQHRRADRGIEESLAGRAIAQQRLCQPLDQRSLVGPLAQSMESGQDAGPAR